MADLQQLELIYQEYEEKLAEAASKASMFAGAFHMGDDPRKDACNQIFYEKLGQWAQEFRESSPTAGEAAQALRWILEYPARHRGSATYWMTYAVQKHAQALIPMVEPAEAGKQGAEFARLYPRTERLPVQREVLRELSARAGKENAPEGKCLLQTWLTRVILLLVGLTIAHFGVTLFLLANLGSDPFNVLIQGLHRLAAGAGFQVLTHGTVHIAVSLLIILVLFVVDRSYVRIGTFLCMLLGGPIIDLFSFALGGVVNEASPMAARVIAVVLGCGVLAFGMTIVIKSQAGTGPNDLVAVVLSDKKGWPFGPVRIGVDVFFALVGFLLGGVVGVGTLICMAVVGPVAQVFMPFSEKICRRFLK
ncbi:MAG: YitT family protein [Faecousia sp.]